MDSAHVCLVAVTLDEDGFDVYKCDRPVSLGVDMESMSKVLRCATKDDIITISAAGVSPDTAKFTFESKDQDRVSEYEMKLMNLEEDQLAIPDTEYGTTVTVSVGFSKSIMSHISSLLIFRCHQWNCKE